MSALAHSSATTPTSEAELRAWFDREVQPFLATHAAAVERLGKWGLYPIAVLLSAFLAAVGLGMAEQLWPALICIAVLIPSIAVVNGRVPIYQAGGAAFRALFKQRVVTQIVARVLPGARYDPDLALARSVVEASGLLDDGIDYRGDDLVRGAIGRTPYALGDVRAATRRRGGASRTVNGLLFHAEFNRSLAGRTVAVPKGEGPSALPSNAGLAPVNLEGPEFAALFSVYASDPIEARYVLTPRAMERLVALARTFARPLYAAFDRRRVYILLDNGTGAFEALAFGGEKAWDEIHGFASLFDGARAIVEELELNTRIWTKGFAPEAEAQAAAASEPSAWTRVAKMGARAFQGSRASMPFEVDDPPAPPATARIERRPGGGFQARFSATWGAPFVLMAVLLGAGFVAIVPESWAARLVREWSGPAALLAASVALTALYRLWTHVRSVEAGGGHLRVGRLGVADRFPAEHVQRVFAAEDLVLAQIQGSWIPVLLSPRLGGHGAALWLAAEIESALSGGPR